MCEGAGVASIDGAFLLEVSRVCRDELVEVRAVKWQVERNDTSSEVDGVRLVHKTEDRMNAVVVATPEETTAPRRHRQRTRALAVPVGVPVPPAPTRTPIVCPHCGCEVWKEHDLTSKMEKATCRLMKRRAELRAQGFFPVGGTYCSSLRVIWPEEHLVFDIDRILCSSLQSPTKGWYFRSPVEGLSSIDVMYAIRLHAATCGRNISLRQAGRDVLEWPPERVAEKLSAPARFKIDCGDSKHELIWDGATHLLCDDAHEDVNAEMVLGALGATTSIECLRLLWLWAEGGKGRMPAGMRIAMILAMRYARAAMPRTTRGDGREQPLVGALQA